MTMIPTMYDFTSELALLKHHITFSNAYGQLLDSNFFIALIAA